MARTDFSDCDNSQRLATCATTAIRRPLPESDSFKHTQPQPPFDIEIRGDSERDTPQDERWAESPATIDSGTHFGPRSGRPLTTALLSGFLQ